MNTLTCSQLDIRNIDCFIDFSWSVHEPGPFWIPPDRHSIAVQLAGQTPLTQKFEIKPFVSERDGKIVGRVAAIINPKITDETGKPIGQLGYFESLNDIEVASSLFKGAASWFSSKNVETVWGPMNGAAHLGYRLMTAGFDHPAFYSEPRNPPYYSSLFKETGFDEICHWHTIEWDLYGAREKFYRSLADRALERTEEWTIEHPDPTQSKTVERIHQVLERSWIDNIGFSPITFAEFKEHMGTLFSKMEVENVKVVVDKKGRDIGFGLLLPHDSEGRKPSLGKNDVQSSFLLKQAKRPAQIIFYMFAVDPSARKTGVGTKIILSSFKTFYEHHYRHAIGSLGKEDLSWLKSGKTTRTYALFQAKIGSLI